MNERVRVPIRVKRGDNAPKQDIREEPQAVVESNPAVTAPEHAAQGQEAEVAPGQSRAERVAPVSRREDEQETEALKEELEVWRDRALRLQAELENFRKRQKRLAEERIEANRARLLRNFLMIADDLERALRAEGGQDSLRDGVKMTYRSVNQLLRQEGVEQIEAKGKAFDPEWHEAVATVPHQDTGVDRDIVVEVAQQGYRLNGRLLRPARVIVAK